MGWTYTCKPRGQTVKDFMAAQFDYDNRAEGRGAGHVIACSSKLNVAYLAYHVQPPNGKKDYVVAIVCLIRHVPSDPLYSFGYKGMDENMGPFECDCPERILKLLSPLEDFCTPSPDRDGGYEWAKRWREECWENVAKRKRRPKLKVGDVVTFEREVSFRNGERHKSLRVESTRPLRFKTPNGGGYGYFIINRRKLEEVVEVNGVRVA